MCFLKWLCCTRKDLSEKPKLQEDKPHLMIRSPFVVASDKDMSISNKHSRGLLEGWIPYYNRPVHGQTVETLTHEVHTFMRIEVGILYRCLEGRDLYSKDGRPRDQPDYWRPTL